MNATSSFDDLREWPLATREECWYAYRPAQPFSASSFQRLRAKKHVSGGIRVHQRKEGRVQGQDRLFSRLNLLSLNARRVGDSAEADRLTRLAEEVEQDEVLPKLLEELGEASINAKVAHPTSVTAEWLRVLSDFCDRTDRIAADARHSPDRFPARVGSVDEGMADLVLKIGHRVLFAELKLSRIERDKPGDGVFVYMLDLGGADELVRVRPGVDLRKSARYEPAEIFDRSRINVEGDAAETVERLLSKPPRQRKVDLSGLRFLP